ncbi:MAG TPA: hypothetical protein VEY67_02355 [Candidatus Dormibacteraeota bacterium]|nr:hypothetical protein [Candidatus Dormibacteraeota bacterium]
MERTAGPDEAVVNAVDHELELVRGAIVMVASGGSSRVSVGGLRFGEQLLEPARRLARAAGVVVIPLWSADEAGAGIAIVRADEGAE